MLNISFYQGVKLIRNSMLKHHLNTVCDDVWNRIGNGKNTVFPKARKP